MKKSLQSYKKEFLYYLGDIRGYSDTTLKTYDTALNGMLNILEVNEENSKTYFNAMPIRLNIASQKPKTIAKKLSVLRSFVNYLNDHDEMVILESNQSVKVPKGLPKPIQHQHILEAINSSDDAMAKLAVILLYTLGLRISELTSLEQDNIADSWVRVLGKGNKQREVPLLNIAKKELDDYCKIYQPKRFIFEKNEEKLSEDSLRYAITKLFKKVGIKMTPHQLRHSYATELLNNSASIADVSELLGHESMATTQIYTKLSSVLKRDNYLKAHPLCQDSKNESD
jgi:integrase/recombinase XerC